MADESRARAAPERGASERFWPRRSAVARAGAQRRAFVRAGMVARGACVAAAAGMAALSAVRRCIIACVGSAHRADVRDAAWTGASLRHALRRARDRAWAQSGHRSQRSKRTVDFL